MNIADVKGNLNKPVLYKEKADTYMFTGCTIRKKEGKCYYQAELTEIKTNTLIYCKLEDIKVIENDN